jgi:hypothetical protein
MRFILAVFMTGIFCNAFGQNQYQYLFSPESEFAGKTIKTFGVNKKDTILHSVLVYNDKGYVVRLENKVFKTLRTIEYFPNEVVIKEYSLGKLISGEKLIISGDSVLVHTSDDQNDNLVGVLFLDLSKNIVTHKKGDRVKSKHIFKDREFVKSIFYSKDESTMVVSRTYLGQNSYIQRTLQGSELSAYSVQLALDSIHIISIQEWRMVENDEYIVERYHHVKKDNAILHLRFEKDSRELEVFEIDSVLNSNLK